MNKNLTIIITVVCGIISVYGQTVNSGQLKVLPGTKFSSVGDFKNTSTANLVNDGTFFVYANFHNDGIIEYDPTQEGITRFVGDQKQNISGTIASKLNHTLFDNHSEQPAFSLTGEISIHGNSDFDYGIVKVEDTGSLIFEEAATHAHANTDSHVEGFVEHHGKQKFEFPVGYHGFYNPEIVGICEWGDAIFRGTYKKEDSNSQYPHSQKEENIQQIDNTQYWILECNHHETHELPLTLSIDGNLLDINPESDSDTEIAIVGWDNENEEWESYLTVVDVGQKLATAMTGHDGIFTLARVEKSDVYESNGLIFYNGISGNDDGRNDYFFIDGLTKFQENTLEIYNRWGVKVYNADQYGSHENWFRGYSNVKGTIDKNEKLPSGTYFYVLTYKTANSKIKRKAGYLYIN